MEGDNSMAKCTPYENHNRRCVLADRSGKCAECARRNQKCDVNEFAVRFDSAHKEQKKLEAALEEEDKRREKILQEVVQRQERLEEELRLSRESLR